MSQLYPPPIEEDPIAPAGAFTKRWKDWFVANRTQVNTGSAPSDAKYWVSTTNVTLTDAVNFGALASGYVKISVAVGIATPSSVAQIPGSDVSHDVVSKTFADSGYVAAPDQTVLVDATLGVTTINLPATPTKGMFVIVKKTDASANAVTVNGNGNLLDGAATQALAARWNAFIIQGSGTAYFITGNV